MIKSFPRHRARRRALLLPVALAVITSMSPLASAAADGAAASRAAAKSSHPAWCSDRCDELIVDWNATAYQVIKAGDGYGDPMAASRVLAMVHLAMHDAVNAVRPRYASHVAVDPDALADPAVAAVSAAHDVLAALYPTQQGLLKATLDKSMFLSTGCFFR